MLNGTMYNYLKDALKSIKGDYLEIGVFDGEGLAMIANNFPEKIIYGVDPFMEDGNTTHITSISRDNKLDFIEKQARYNTLPYRNACLFVMTSKEFGQFYPKVTNAFDDISAVFIDGSHWYDDVTYDYHLAVSIINGKKGIVAFDDLLIPDVNKAYNEFLTIYKDIIEKVINVHVDNGLSYMSAVYIN